MLLKQNLYIHSFRFGSKLLLLTPGIWHQRGMFSVTWLMKLSFHLIHICHSTSRTPIPAAIPPTMLACSLRISRICWKQPWGWKFDDSKYIIIIDQEPWHQMKLKQILIFRLPKSHCAVEFAQFINLPSWEFLDCSFGVFSPARCAVVPRPVYRGSCLSSSSSEADCLGSPSQTWSPQSRCSWWNHSTSAGRRRTSVQREH